MSGGTTGNEMGSWMDGYVSDLAVVVSRDVQGCLLYKEVML